jgi:hypothetical protein
MVPIGQYSCALCRIKRAYPVCGLFDVMFRMCSLNRNSSLWFICPMYEKLRVWHFSW